jgi:hypothetical protein
MARMTTIGIVLVAMPRMLRDIVADSVAREPDMEIYDAADPRELAAISDETDARLAITSLRDPTLPEAWRRLLLDRPEIKVLAIEDEGRTAFLYELQPRRTALGQLTPEALVAAIRLTVSQSARTTS